jgi:type IV pilus assembly protein PilM
VSDPRGPAGASLVRFGFAPLPPQTIVDGQVMDAGNVVEVLQRVFHDARIRQKEVALSVSGQSVIIRKITVPIMTAAELDEQIHWEAEQHIPFDIKDVQVDYQVLRRRPEASQMDLLLVAAKRDQINDYAQLARDAKLRPVVCDIDAFTVQNLFEATRGLPPEQTIAIINVGASLSSLNIVSTDQRLHARDRQRPASHHRGDPEEAQHPRSSRPRGTSAAARPGQKPTAPGMSRKWRGQRAGEPPPHRGRDPAVARFSWPHGCTRKR